MREHRLKRAAMGARKRRLNALAAPPWCVHRLPKITARVIGSTTLQGTLRFSSSKFARLANSRFWQKGWLRGRIFFWAFLAAIGEPIVL